jgi:hypothetical protein
VFIFTEFGDPAFRDDKIAVGVDVDESGNGFLRIMATVLGR